MGVGMPQCILLQQFGRHILQAFGEVPYWVGSSMTDKSGWRDVDVRLLLPDDRFLAEGYGHPAVYPQGIHENGKWVSTVLAWSCFGHHLTGLPIDFQIQPVTWANKNETGNRGALIDLVFITAVSEAFYRGKVEK
jgi:hypothetical protein